MRSRRVESLCWIDTKPESQPARLPSMTDIQVFSVMWAGIYLLVHLAFVARSILRPHRQPASRVAWVVVILVVPIGGIAAYILLGETNIGRRRVARRRNVQARLPDPAIAPGTNDAHLQPKIPDRHAPLFRVGQAVNGFEAIGGNQAERSNVGRWQMHWGLAS